MKVLFVEYVQLVKKQENGYRNMVSSTMTDIS